MARTILLATLARRQGTSFQLKTAGYQVIGTMTLNPATARHEMELSEEDFLKHSKELARLCAIPGMGWYVVEFRESRADGAPGDSPLKKINEGTFDAGVARDDLDGQRMYIAPNPDGGVIMVDHPITEADHIPWGKMSDEEKEPVLQMIARLGSDLEGKKFFALQKIAKEAGVDMSSPYLKGEHRLKLAIINARTLSKVA